MADTQNAIVVSDFKPDIKDIHNTVQLKKVIALPADIRKDICTRGDVVANFSQRRCLQHILLDALS